jgi:transposase
MKQAPHIEDPAPSLPYEDWLPKDHLARFVVDIVDQLDLSALTRHYRGSGSTAYHPAVTTAI